MHLKKDILIQYAGLRSNWSHWKLGWIYKWNSPGHIGQCSENQPGIVGCLQSAERLISPNISAETWSFSPFLITTSASFGVFEYKSLENAGEKMLVISIEFDCTFLFVFATSVLQWFAFLYVDIWMSSWNLWSTLIVSKYCHFMGSDLGF